jgi:hypothetical protein
MKFKLSFAACAFLLSGTALADEAMDKCVADVTAYGEKDPQGGCTCFFESISEEDAEAYLDVSDWENEASDDMKEAGAACFPDIQ